MKLEVELKRAVIITYLVKKKQERRHGRTNSDVYKEEETYDSCFERQTRQ